MSARDVMTSPVVTVRQGATLETAAETMLEHGIGGVPVVDGDGRLVGILTEQDFIAEEESVPWGFFKAPKLFDMWLDQGQIDEAYERAREIPVKRIMSKPVRSVGPDDSVDKVVELMLRHGISHVPVVEDGEVVGIITHRDMLRMMRRG